MFSPRDCTTKKRNTYEADCDVDCVMDCRVDGSESEDSSDSSAKFLRLDVVCYVCLFESLIIKWMDDSSQMRSALHLALQGNT